MGEQGDGASQYLDYMLAIASDRIGRQLRKAMDKRGVSIEYWRILSFLQSGVGRSMGELAEVSLLSLPTATRVVDRMVSDALVYRMPDPHDRRKVVIFVSDAGLAMWTELKQAVDSYQASVSDRFGDAWMRELIARLDRLVEPAGEADGGAARD